MEKYVCKVCGYVYDPEKGDPDSGIQPGTPFGQLSDDWVCPVCGAGKDQFEKQRNATGQSAVDPSQEMNWNTSSARKETADERYE